MLAPLQAALNADDFETAIRLIRAELRRGPDSHWLWTRLSTSHYELRHYRMALRASERAYQLEPRCPLVLWDLAGALQMLGRHQEALLFYRRILRRPLSQLAHGHCGEGVGRARGLIADTHYRVSLSLRALGRRSQSLAAFERHIGLRGPGCYSIYRLGELSGPKPAARRRTVAFYDGPAVKRER